MAAAWSCLLLAPSRKVYGSIRADRMEEECVTRPKRAAFMVVGNNCVGRELLPSLRTTWHQSSTCSQLNVSGLPMLQMQDNAICLHCLSQSSQVHIATHVCFLWRRDIVRASLLLCTLIRLQTLMAGFPVAEANNRKPYLSARTSVEPYASEGTGAPATVPLKAASDWLIA